MLLRRVRPDWICSTVEEEIVESACKNLYGEFGLQVKEVRSLKIDELGRRCRHEGIVFFRGY